MEKIICVQVLYNRDGDHQQSAGGRFFGCMIKLYFQIIFYNFFYILIVIQPLGVMALKLKNYIIIFKFHI